MVVSIISSQDLFDNNSSKPLKHQQMFAADGIFDVCPDLVPNCLTLW